MGRCHGMRCKAWAVWLRCVQAFTEKGSQQASPGLPMASLAAGDEDWQANQSGCGIMKTRAAPPEEGAAPLERATRRGRRPNARVPSRPTRWGARAAGRSRPTIPANDEGVRLQSEAGARARCVPGLLMLAAGEGRMPKSVQRAAKHGLQG
ncbi:MAG: hypothetical protein J3K34DRAFT_404512 [Monoraphidium minutum]|nr:MAG: hypothetical protein J3K34DRAFT_404512 [Monoraphidium minutum]